jgi:hypothetical protein
MSSSLHIEQSLLRCGLLAMTQDVDRSPEAIACPEPFGEFILSSSKGSR